MAEQVTLTIKLSTGAKFTVSSTLKCSVAEFKAHISGEVGVAPEEQRLIYAGHVLKDASSMESYNIKDGHTIHLVKGVNKARTQGAPAAPTAQTAQAQSPFGGMGGMGGMGGIDPSLLQNPAVQGMMEQLMQNPQAMQAMMDANPMFANMPAETRAMMTNPEVMRQAMAAMRNPNLANELGRQADLAMGNLETSAEGHAALRRAFASGDPADQVEDAPAPAADNPFAALFNNGGAAAAPAPAASPDQPLPNPWAAAAPQQPQQQPQQQGMPGMGMGMGMGGMGGMPGMAAMLQNPAQMQAMLNNPMMQQMMDQMLQNPQMLEAMLASNPMFANMPPETRAAMANPDLIRAAMQMQRGAMGAGAGGAPAAGAAPAAGSAPAAGDNPFANLFQQQQQQQQQAPAAAGAAPGAAGFNPFMFGGAAAPAAAPAASTVAPEVRYEQQLGQLIDMGFVDPQANLRALMMSGGNVQAAINLLLQ